MAMGTERSSKPLHNFAMPCLKWGSQRFLRCMKVNSNGDVVGAVDRRSSAPAPAPAGPDPAACHVDRSLVIGNRRHRESEFDRRGSNYFSRIGGGDSFKLSPSPSPEIRRKLKQERDGEDGIEAVRAKLMFDLQTAADKMKDAILRERLEEEEEDEQPPPPPPPVVLASAEAPADAESEAVRPWNLRTRRAACKAPNGGIIVGGGGAGGSNGKCLKLDVLKPSFSPTRSEIKSPRLRGGAAAAVSPSGEKRERAKFSVSLSRREIEEDFMSMLGQRPSRRPKKRPKVVQKQLDTLFPGLWLSEVNADLYKVPEAAETGKR